MQESANRLQQQNSETFETALSSVFYRWTSASLCAVATH
ncbi:hypothetical protein PPL19_09797 [Pseudomonas psychrotolerans L19]|nr:hypothetical protein PPL19_09797 [Pseudomonas psychrotolerans L19]